MNATCPDQDTLQAYLLGDLDDDAIEVHLDVCAGCQAKFDELDAVVNRPFVALRKRGDAETDWQQPAFQRLVGKAKAIRQTDLDREDEPEQLPRQLGDYLLLERLAKS